MTNATADEPREITPFRAFSVDGESRTDTTHRVQIVESITPIAGRSFIDIGACDGYEARALAVRGASRVVALEGKQVRWEEAVRAAESLGMPNHQVILGDLREIERYGLGSFDCVCCFGVLYHMSNPFNVLKRLAHVTEDLLLLETHIAPEPWTEAELLPKHQGALLHGTRTLYLDGARFEGRICIHRGEHAVSKGSLDENWTFWLTASSLAKALTRAGFSILEWHHELDAQTPDTIGKRGRELGLGHANTKILVVAKVDPARRQPITHGTVSNNAAGTTPPCIRETLIDRFLYNAARVRRRLRF
jgi:hypothetical protein